MSVKFAEVLTPSLKFFSGFQLTGNLIATYGTDLSHTDRGLVLLCVFFGVAEVWTPFDFRFFGRDYVLGHGAGAEVDGGSSSFAGLLVYVLTQS